MPDAPVRVERFRRNDHVGAPIWGFRGAVKDGDRVVYSTGFPAHRDLTGSVQQDTGGRLMVLDSRTGRWEGYVV